MNELQLQTEWDFIISETNNEKPLRNIECERLYLTEREILFAMQIYLQNNTDFYLVLKRKYLKTKERRKTLFKKTIKQ
jgi:hypothetical protein